MACPLLLASALMLCASAVHAVVASLVASCHELAAKFQEVDLICACADGKRSCVETHHLNSITLRLCLCLQNANQPTNKPTWSAAIMATAIAKTAHTFAHTFAHITGSAQRQKDRYGNISGLDQVVAEHDELR